MRNCIFLFFFQLGFFTYSQETFPVNGPDDPRLNFHAFTNATIVVSPNETMESATVVVREGKIISVSKNDAPEGAIVHDLSGKMIYPSFIELNSDYGVLEKEVKSSWSSRPQPVSKKQGAYGWNEAIRPEINAIDGFVVKKNKAEELRKMGFGAVLTHIPDGIHRGTGGVVALSEQSEHQAILKTEASIHFSFSKGSSKQSYPSSLMGSIALLRQSYLDAEWYKQNNEETNLSLAAWNRTSSLPAFFETTDVLDILRANEIAKEFSTNYIFIGNGDEYQRLDEIKATNSTVVIPLNFPKAYNVENPLDARSVSYQQMKHWQLAPYNPSFLEQENIPFAISSSKLKDKKSFLKNLKKAVENGLSKEDALAALTTIPAQLINQSDVLGTIEKGKWANFIITDGNLFEKGKILENIVQGERFIIAESSDDSIDGKYNLTVGDKSYDLLITEAKFTVNENDSTKLKTNGEFKNGLVSLSFNTDDGKVRLSGWQQGNQLKGSGFDENGNPVSWNAFIQAEDAKDGVDDINKKNAEPDAERKYLTTDEIRYPFVGYGWKEQPKQERVLFRNATVWTNEDDGILENTDVLISNGKIEAIGQNLSTRRAKEIDATGLHLTAGIIDEHSHISISRGVNEATQASSAEVRIGDVINSEHVALYRVLAGGVTASQLLHGSANPIGGQSAIIKSRWGLAPEKMKFENANGFIKFALGENVKQSNWGDNFQSRFPQTRMGVEQVYEDYFTRAREYEQAMQANPTNTRRNLDLEAVLEVLNSERFISCHSYVQSEITMLMQVAERHGFRVNTFTHILEGYKVADQMLEHGVGASTFSDWWAYKYEVIDAIPYNAAVLQREGVITAINSDDAEMGRRLNQEAAKVVRYGGVSEEEAWKMVTLNPAKLLHIDDRVGSIKVGKDADIVLWSDHPMSIYAIAQQTYVDGRKYYDIEEEKQRNAEIKQEREELIQLMLDAKKSGEPTQKAKQEATMYYSCKQLGEMGAQYIQHHHHAH